MAVCTSSVHHTQMHALFYCLYIGEEIPANMVLSNHVVISVEFCGQLCLGEFLCTAFNYLKAGNETKVNCQLTDSINQNKDVFKGESNWEFYQSNLVCIWW